MTTQFSGTFCISLIAAVSPRRRPAGGGEPPYIPHPFRTAPSTIVHLNALRAFGAIQWDITLRGQFRVTERLGLQPRPTSSTSSITQTSAARGARILIRPQLQRSGNP